MSLFAGLRLPSDIIINIEHYGESVNPDSSLLFFLLLLPLFLFLLCFLFFLILLLLLLYSSSSPLSRLFSVSRASATAFSFRWQFFHRRRRFAEAERSDTEVIRSRKGSTKAVRKGFAQFSTTSSRFRRPFPDLYPGRDYSNRGIISRKIVPSLREKFSRARCRDKSSFPRGKYHHRILYR